MTDRVTLRRQQQLIDRMHALQFRSDQADLAVSVAPFPASRNNFGLFRPAKSGRANTHRSLSRDENCGNRDAVAAGWSPDVAEVQVPASPATLWCCLAVLQCNVPSWEYGKPLKQRLLPAHLRRLTHEDSAQLTNWRYRHRSGLYPSGSGDGSRCQKPVLCSRRWMTGTRSVRWMRWER